MQLAVHEDDADVLLQQKNKLDDKVLDKYRVAGKVVQSGLKYIINLINDSYHLGTNNPLSSQEICYLGDSYLARLLAKVYNNDVKEKGIATPVTVEVNDIVGGFSPEIDDETPYIFSVGDIVTVSLGVQIDGYTANVSHTIVIYPQGHQVDSKPAPEGPLVGANADAICAAHIATESLVALLGLAMSPEKVPTVLGTESGKITGSQIRLLVDTIAAQYNCVVVPDSKVRRVRRFLAGQAEGIVAEKDFKGVVWTERDQELGLLKNANATGDLVLAEKSKAPTATTTSVIPTDDFVVFAGEVYSIDIRMCSIGSFEEPGIITLDEIDQFTGKNNQENQFSTRPTIHIRDYAVHHQLRLKSSRKLLGQIDKRFTVYPFKLSYVSDSFPFVDGDVETHLEGAKKEVQQLKLGLSELSNRRLVRSRPVQVARFVPLEKILLTDNTTGRHGIDAEKPVLPGLEVPLPKLGISSLKLKSLLKHSKSVPVARESCTIVLNEVNNDVIRLSGSGAANPSWVHSQYQLTGAMADTVNQLSTMMKDKRFGINIKETRPYREGKEEMDMN